jgi:3-oxoacyl-[acyl-carrier protein] reductase
MTRTAIVTGAARGLGRAIALRLAADGNDVAVVDLDAAGAESVAAEIRGMGRSALAVTADVSNEQQVVDAVGRIAAELGAPTILVNNAGILRDNLLFKMTVEDWDLVMGVHLRGAFLFSREAQKHMVGAGWGRIVSISSISADGNRGQSNYSAAKMGLQGLTKTLALELGRFGITANAIAPGYIESDMTRATAARQGIEWDVFSAEIAKGITVGRVGQPEDVAAAVSYFASEAASFTTGQTLYVTGNPKG